MEELIYSSEYQCELKLSLGDQNRSYYLMYSDPRTWEDSNVFQVQNCLNFSRSLTELNDMGQISFERYPQIRFLSNTVEDKPHLTFLFSGRTGYIFWNNTGVDIIVNADVNVPNEALHILQDQDVLYVKNTEREIVLSIKYNSSDHLKGEFQDIDSSLARVSFALSEIVQKKWSYWLIRMDQKLKMLEESITKKIFDHIDQNRSQITSFTNDRFTLGFNNIAHLILSIQKSNESLMKQFNTNFNKTIVVSCIAVAALLYALPVVIFYTLPNHSAPSVESEKSTIRSKWVYEIVQFQEKKSSFKYLTKDPELSNLLDNIQKIEGNFNLAKDDNIEFLYSDYKRLKKEFLTLAKRKNDKLLGDVRSKLVKIDNIYAEIKVIIGSIDYSLTSKTTFENICTNIKKIKNPQENNHLKLGKKVDNTYRDLLTLRKKMNLEQGSIWGCKEYIFTDKKIKLLLPQNFSHISTIQKFFESIINKPLNYSDNVPNLLEVMEEYFAKSFAVEKPFHKCVIRYNEVKCMLFAYSLLPDDSKTAYISSIKEAHNLLIESVKITDVPGKLSALYIQPLSKEIDDL